LKRIRLYLLMLLAVGLLVAGCTDPVANTPLQDQDPPQPPTRVKVFPPYNAAEPDAVPGTSLVYREWANDPYGFGDGLRRPKALEHPYVVMYESGGEQEYTGFNIYRSEAGSSSNFTLLGEKQYPETMRTKPDWSTGDPVPEDPPTREGDELDFPAYLADQDGFKGYQDPLDQNWDPRNRSGYFPLHYYASNLYAYGFVDSTFDVTTMNYENYYWAVVFIDAVGNMSEPVIIQAQ
jgi:hypothetical protein